MSSIPPVMTSVLPESWTPRYWMAATIDHGDQAEGEREPVAGAPVQPSELEMT